MVRLQSLKLVLSVGVHPSTPLRYARDERMNAEVERLSTNGRSRTVNAYCEVVVPHALTFVDAFTPAGLLGAGIQTGSWLFIFWHIGFALGLLGYAVLRGDKRAPAVTQKSAVPAIGWSVAGVLAAVLEATAAYCRRSSSISSRTRWRLWMRWRMVLEC
jgi:hypothetical protein